MLLRFLHSFEFLSLSEVSGSGLGFCLGVDGLLLGLFGELQDSQLELAKLLLELVLLLLLLQQVGLEAHDGLAQRQIVGEEQHVHHVLKLVVQ